jgi:hypothetical protein
MILAKSQRSEHQLVRSAIIQVIYGLTNMDADLPVNPDDRKAPF